MIEDHFVMRNEQSYAAFCGTLSYVYTKAFLLQKNVKLYVHADSRMFSPVSSQPESAVDRIIFLNNKMIRKGFEVDLEIVEYDSMITMAEDQKSVGMIHPTGQCWSMKKDGGEHNITCNLPPQRRKFQRLAVVDGGRLFSKEEIEKHVMPDAYLDYSTPIKKVYEHLNKSKLHISYQGGSAWISILMGIPTIIVHNLDPSKETKHYKIKIYGQDPGQVNYYSEEKIHVGERHPKEIHIRMNELDNVFKLGCLSPTYNIGNKL